MSTNMSSFAMVYLLWGLHPPEWNMFNFYLFTIYCLIFNNQCIPILTSTNLFYFYDWFQQLFHFHWIHFTVQLIKVIKFTKIVDQKFTYTWVIYRFFCVCNSMEHPHMVFTCVLLVLDCNQCKIGQVVHTRLYKWPMPNLQMPNFYLIQHRKRTLWRPKNNNSTVVEVRKKLSRCHSPTRSTKAIHPDNCTEISKVWDSEA